MATSRLYAVVVAMWCVAGASAHIIQLHAGQSECLYEEFGVEHLLAGESEATVPTEVALAFVVRAHKAGPSTISNPVAVNASDPYGTLLVQKTGAYEEDLRFYAHGTGRYQVCFANKFDAGVGWSKSKHNARLVSNVELLYFSPTHGVNDPAIIKVPHGTEHVRQEHILDTGSLDNAHDVVLEMKKEGAETSERWRVAQRQVNMMLQEQKYMVAREARHRVTIESTSKRTTLWAVVEFVAFASANCVQVLIVRRFFQSDPRRGRSKPAPHTYSYSLPGELQG